MNLDFLQTPPNPFDEETLWSVWVAVGGEHPRKAAERKAWEARVVLHATPFLPDADLGEHTGSALTYSPSFIDVGRLRRRAQRMYVLAKRGGAVPTVELERIRDEIKSSIRGDTSVSVTPAGRVTIKACDRYNTYNYSFNLNIQES